MYARCRRTGAGEVNYAVLARPSPYFLKASFTFRRVFEVEVRLIALALILGALVAGDLADRFLGLTAKSWALFFALSVPLTVSALTLQSARVAELRTVGTSRAGGQTSDSHCPSR
jgi:hypothetical protein